MRSLGSELTKRAIVDAAVDAFTAKGFHGTSTRELALMASCSVSTLYDHFESKEAILVHIIDDIVAELNNVVLAALNEADFRPSTQLWAAVYAHVGLHCRRPQQSFIAASEIRSLGDEHRKVYMKKRDIYEARFRNILREGLTNGEFLVRYPTEAARAILIMSTGVASWFRPSGGMSIDEVASHHADLALAIVRNGACCRQELLLPN